MTMSGLNQMRLRELEWSGDALDRLAELRAAKDLIDYMTEEAVTECRRSGYGKEFIDDVADWRGTGTETREGHNPEPISWERIAEQLHVTRQTAWKRFRHVES